MIQQTSVKSEFIPFKGGLDVVSPTISIPPGFVRQSLNYEEDINQGYVSLTGYERFDGQTSPSSASYLVLPYIDAGTVAIGDTLTGGTSAATGKVIAIIEDNFVLTKTTGTFGSEAANSATVVGPGVINGASGADGANFKNLAADVYRTDILAVPGAGNILGVYYYKGVVYAFRNKSGSGVGMYKSTSSGWSEIALGIEVTYNTGSGTQPVPGATITKGGTSATLKAITVESGSFGAGTAAGRLIFATVTSGPFTAGALTAGMSGTVVSQADITIPNKNGRFSFITANFYGQLESASMYGCDGANRGFGFDGTTFVPINTGTAVDQPLHIAEHANHLFFSFGSSVIHSSLGDPYNWTAGLGASEIALGDTITGFKPQVGSSTDATLAVFCRNRTYMLYGTDASTWTLVNYSVDTGAIPYSVQKIGSTFMLDDRGISSLTATQDFGNFAESTVSQQVKSLLATKRSQLTDSQIARDKQQYRIFFSDKTGLYCTINRKYVSIMLVTFPESVLCSVSEETYGGGSEVIFFGSSDGFVYQMEKGTSFDGDDIEAYLHLVFNHSKGYRVLKKYRRMTFEINSTGYSEFETSYDISKGSVEAGQSDVENHIQASSTPLWDQFVWDQFTWDGQSNTDLSISTPGVGDNISVKIRHKCDCYTPMKFSGVFLEYSPLRMER